MKTYVDDTGEYLATPLPDGKTRRGEADDSMRALVYGVLLGSILGTVFAWALWRMGAAMAVVLR